MPCFWAEKFFFWISHSDHHLSNLWTDLAKEISTPYLHTYCHHRLTLVTFFPLTDRTHIYVTLKVELNKNHDVVYSSPFQVSRSPWLRYPKRCKFPLLRVPVLLKEHTFLPKVPSKHLSEPCAKYCVNKIKKVLEMLASTDGSGITNAVWFSPLLIRKCQDTSSPKKNGIIHASVSHLLQSSYPILGPKWYVALGQTQGDGEKVPRAVVATWLPRVSFLPSSKNEGRRVSILCCIDAVF